MQPVSVVKVPVNDEMATEPARAIAKAQVFKNAVVVILAAMGYMLSPELNGAIDTLLQGGVTLGLILWTWYSTRQQGEATREAVFSPAAAADLAKTQPAAVAVETGEPQASIIANIRARPMVANGHDGFRPG